MRVLSKAVTIIMILVFAVTVLGGCAKNQDNSSAATSTAAKATGVSTGTPTGTAADSTGNNSGSKVIKQGTIEKNGNVILKELAFVYNGNTIAISDTADDEKLESILGKAVESKSHTYSKDDGKNMDPLIGFTEKQYKFTGLDIKTINASEDKSFYVFNIKITDPKYSTVRNIKVGDSVEKLKEAYPEGNMLEADEFRYLPANYVDGMIFKIKAKKVESIHIYKLLD